MRYRHVKSVPIIVTGALLSAMAVVEARRKPYHIEPRQHEEPSRLTYDVTSTATFVTGVRLLGPFINSDSLSGTSFRVIFTESSTKDTENTLESPQANSGKTLKNQ
jgi:hypothetical protein